MDIRIYAIAALLFGAMVWIVVWGHITSASVTIFLHRAQAHPSIKLHAAVSHFFRFWLWLTTGMVTREWAAVHRKHHAEVEQEDDPHSPQKYGIWKVLFGGVWLYRKEAKDQETLEKYGRGTPDDWIERNLYSHPVGRYLGVLLLLAVDLSLLSMLVSPLKALLVGLGVWLGQILWIPFFGAGVINGIGHYWGYRNFETPDASRNLWPRLKRCWMIVTVGEEHHNNHHKDPSSAQFSYLPQESDMGWFYIKLLAALNLCEIKRSTIRAT